jgi:hypothetical protein
MRYKRCSNSLVLSVSLGRGDRDHCEESDHCDRQPHVAEHQSGHGHSATALTGAPDLGQCDVTADDPAETHPNDREYQCDDGEGVPSSVVRQKWRTLVCAQFGVSEAPGLIFAR